MGVLTVTFINGVLNLIRLLIMNEQLADFESYKKRLTSISSFQFKKYKSSQYRRMGEDLYKEYFFDEGNADTAIGHIDD